MPDYTLQDTYKDLRLEKGMSDKDIWDNDLSFCIRNLDERTRERMKDMCRREYEFSLYHSAINELIDKRQNKRMF